MNILDLWQGIPPVYGAIYISSRSQYPVSSQFSYDYIHAIRTNGLLALCTTMGIKVWGSASSWMPTNRNANININIGSRFGIIDKQEPTFPLCSSVVRNIRTISMVYDYLTTLRSLLWLEEAHMLQEIAHYDAQLVTCKFKRIVDKSMSRRIPKDAGAGVGVGDGHDGHGINSLNMTLETWFTVPGSNESRPHIAIGDEIRMRPVREDFLSVCYRFRIDPNLYAFEFVGIVTSYNLKTERCGVILQAPHHFSMYPLSSLSTEQCIDMYWQHMRYVIRFACERCGLAFAQIAIEKVSRDVELLQCLFPGIIEDGNQHGPQQHHQPQHQPQQQRQSESVLGPHRELFNSALPSLSDVIKHQLPSANMIPLLQPEVVHVTSLDPVISPTSSDMHSQSNLRVRDSMDDEASNVTTILQIDGTTTTTTRNAKRSDEVADRFNVEQRAAIDAIVARSHSLSPEQPLSSPLLIFGPPGTGYLF